jgi:hypothetical protein avisC_11510
LLGLVLAELSAGTLPLGSRSTRGLGQVVVSTIVVRGSTWDGVAIPERKLNGDRALAHLGTAVSNPTPDRHKAQRALAGNVLDYLKKVKGATSWSKHLENSPEAASKQSERTGTADD